MIDLSKEGFFPQLNQQAVEKHLQNWEDELFNTPCRGEDTGRRYYPSSIEIPDDAKQEGEILIYFEGKSKPYRANPKGWSNF